MTDNGAYELLQEGRRLMEEGRPDEAIPLLELAKLLAPRKGSILEALGQAHFNVGHPSRAREQFEEALSIDPTNHWAHYCLSLCLNRLGRLSEAVGHLQLAVVMEPANQSYRDTLHRFRFRLSPADGQA